MMHKRRIDAVIKEADELGLEKFVIVIDKERSTVHLRETLCVIHRGESGEAHYHTKPTVRKVIVFENKKNEYNIWNKERIGIGKFIRYGCDYEEFESGAGNFSTAIIEMEDGSVKNHPVELIQFLSD